MAECLSQVIRYRINAPEDWLSCSRQGSTAAFCELDEESADNSADTSTVLALRPSGTRQDMPQSPSVTVFGSRVRVVSVLTAQVDYRRLTLLDFRQGLLCRTSHRLGHESNLSILCVSPARLSSV
jgi:hypothetical protein